MPRPLFQQQHRAPTAGWWLIALLGLLLVAAIDATRLPLGELRGDEGTYVAMIESLVHDRDLTFEADDAARVRARDGGSAVILQRTARGVSYSKPILYPLLAAPAFALGGDRGLIAFNALVLGLGLAVARALLARVGPPPLATGTVLIFAAASAVVGTVGWRMSEALVVGLALGGLALALAAERAAPRPPTGRAERLLAWPGAPWLGATLLGLLVSLREPHAAVAIVPALVAAACGRWRRAAGFVAVLAVSWGAVLALTAAVSGAAQPYKAVRATFDSASGYPGEPAAGPEAGSMELRPFVADGRLATSSLGLRPAWQPRTSLYAAGYFFLGRHSGLLVHFPLVGVLLAILLRCRDVVGRAALAAFAVLALFYLIWWPANYFGGEAFAGNRYILAALAGLLVALPRLPSARTLVIVTAGAALVGGSALLSALRTAGPRATSQSHTHAGLFRLLPYESTASNIDGRRDRYWAEDFVRFVDPFADVAPHSFELRSDAPAAELELVTSRPGGRTQWLVTTDVPQATLRVRDWRRERRIELQASPGGQAGGMVTAQLAPAWRLHPFWWAPGASQRARLIRLAIESPDGRLTRARVRYLGRGGLPGRPARELVAAELPSEGTAGGHGHGRLELRNTGRWPWVAGGVLPVQLGWRLVPHDGGDGTTQGRSPLPHRVPPGRPVVVEFDLDWPQRSGRYRLEVDLLIEDLFWFGDRIGAPLAAVDVELAAPEAAAFEIRSGEP